jgi:hypothetical protein
MGRSGGAVSPETDLGIVISKLGFLCRIGTRKPKIEGAAIAAGRSVELRDNVVNSLW